MNKSWIILLCLMQVKIILYGQPSDVNKLSSEREKSGVTKYGESASLRGRITDEKNNPLQGASVVITGTGKGVHTNENGEFLIDNLQAVNVNVQASIMGYKTRMLDMKLR